MTNKIFYNLKSEYKIDVDTYIVVTESSVLYH